MHSWFCTCWVCCPPPPLDVSDIEARGVWCIMCYTRLPGDEHGECPACRAELS